MRSLVGPSIVFPKGRRFLLGIISLRAVTDVLGASAYTCRLLGQTVGGLSGFVAQAIRASERSERSGYAAPLT